jgi:hypothetical protein
LRSKIAQHNAAVAREQAKREEASLDDSAKLAGTNNREAVAKEYGLPEKKLRHAAKLKKIAQALSPSASRSCCYCLQDADAVFWMQNHNITVPGCGYWPVPLTRRSRCDL